MLVLYAVVFLVGFALSDLNALRICGSTGQGVYAIDLINLAAIMLAIVYVADGGMRRLSRAARWYAALLAWLLVELVIGFSRYGGSALGEFRYVMPLFWFLAPLGIESLRRSRDDVEYATVPLTIVWVSAAAALAMLVIEIANGGRYYFTAANASRAGFEDFRGARFLDSYQTFAIAFAGTAALLRARAEHLGTLIPVACVFFVAAVWTQNRTALIALLGALAVLALLERRFALLVGTGIGTLVAVGLLAALLPDLSARLASTYRSALNPAADDSGTWRLLIQLSAFSQALNTPWFGQAYGGYFRFELPNGTEVLAPPHSQFLVLFLKGGVVAVALAVAALLAYSIMLWKSRRDPFLAPRERLVIELLLVLAVSQWLYGLAYDFLVTLGLLLGCAEVLLQRARRRNNPAADPIPRSSLAGFDGSTLLVPQ